MEFQATEGLRIRLIEMYRNHCSTAHPSIYEANALIPSHYTDTNDGIVVIFVRFCPQYLKNCRLERKTVSFLICFYNCGL